MVLPEKYEPNFNYRDFQFSARVVHFENRYWSIDQLLQDLPIKNILEISAGFSFRGLAAVAQDGIHYIDTDLPEVTASKKRIIEAIHPQPINPKSKYEVLSLNVLDKREFDKIVSRFPSGEPIVIVNEGLLMYLSTAEKKRLCGIIRKILNQQGGYWITADIYIKGRVNNPDMQMEDNLAKFFEKHRIREQMFESFEKAEAFFAEQGFIVSKKATRDPERLSTLQYLIQNSTPKQLATLQKTSKIQETWRM